MKAVIELDVPEWQIGQDVSVYFPDTMVKHGKCELLKADRETVCRKLFNRCFITKEPQMCGMCEFRELCEKERTVSEWDGSL